MSRLLSIPLALTVLALQSGPVLAQAEGANRAAWPAEAGAFDRAYPEAAELLNSLNEAYGVFLEQLDAQRGSEIETATFDQVLGSMRSGTSEPTSLRSAMPRFADDHSDIADALAWGHEFERALYDIYADDGIADKRAAVDQAVDRYLSRQDIALPAEPKSMSGGGHEHMDMGGHHSMMFQSSYPNANRLIWAGHWLQVALFDPLLFYPAQEQRREGVAKVVDRFQELLADAPNSLPTQMPTPAAVAPELVRMHPRAAAILDNLHVLHAGVADVLVESEGSERRASLQSAFEDVRDPTHMAVTEYNWILNSLRHGIYYQGGPAIGRLERPERNREAGHANHGGMVMPGMSAPGGTDPAAEPSAPGDQPGPDHSGH